VISVSPEHEDFSDLEPWRDVIRDAHVVMLGEQSHGDGTTFLAKTRLVKFLHQEMSFDVLAFESGFYDVRKSWNLIKGGETALTAMRQSLFAVWTYSQHFQSLIDYVGASQDRGTPLELAGFDLQFSGRASQDFLVQELEDFLDRIESSVPQVAEWAPVSQELQRLVNGEWGETKPTFSTKVQIDHLLATARDEADTVADAGLDPEASFWAQALRSTIAQVRYVYEHVPFDPQRDLSSLRDEQMAENLLWLIQESCQDRKVIVWAATSHIIRNIDEIERPNSTLSFDGVLTMGHRVRQRLGTGVYVLGFTAHSGSYGWYNQPSRSLQYPPAGSLESLLGDAGLNYAIIDFRNPPAGGEWLKEEISSRPLGYSNMVANWTRLMDGIMFTRTMEASEMATR
jgi:erythromycin esterase